MKTKRYFTVGNNFDYHNILENNRKFRENPHDFLEKVLKRDPALKLQCDYIIELELNDDEARGFRLGVEHEQRWDDNPITSVLYNSKEEAFNAIILQAARYVKNIDVNIENKNETSATEADDNADDDD